MTTESPAGEPPTTVGQSVEQKQCPEIRVFLTCAGGFGKFSRERRLVMMQPGATIAGVCSDAAPLFAPGETDKPKEPPPVFVGVADANGPQELHPLPLRRKQLPAARTTVCLNAAHPPPVCCCCRHALLCRLCGATELQASPDLEKLRCQPLHPRRRTARCCAQLMAERAASHLWRYRWVHCGCAPGEDSFVSKAGAFSCVGHKVLESEASCTRIAQ